MQNGIIKGQGNSRYLKSGIGSSTTWEQFLASLIAGTLPIDLNGINEDGWDQLGTPLNKATLLSDSTETELFGDAQNRTVDQAFMGLLAKIQLIMQNVANMTLTVTDTNGTPLPGVYVNGVFNAGGESMATNASGQITGYVAEGTTTLSVSGYADLLNFSTQFTATKGETYTHTIQLTTRNFLKLTSSQNVRFSGNVQTVDVNPVGGGGPGGSSYGNYVDNDENHSTGGAGGGGHSVIQMDLDVTPNTNYPAVVGSGGANGSVGGTSSFMGISAAGGNPGGNASGSRAAGVGGTGNGNGANGSDYRDHEGSASYVEGKNGSPGTETSLISFEDTGFLGGGGGSGQIGGAGDYYGKGGGYGGDGGNGRSSGFDGKPGQDGFGGGGGSPGTYVDYQGYGRSGDPGRGGSGCIAMRMHLKSAA